MDELKLVKQILTKSTVIVCENLDPKPLLLLMQSEGALTPNDVTLIKTKVTTSDQSQELLNILMTKPVKAYEVFMDGLRQNGRKDIYDLIVKKESEAGYSRARKDSAGSTEEVSTDSISVTPVRLLAGGPSWPPPSDDIASESDIADLIAELLTNQLQNAYSQLGIDYRQVRKAEERANTTDPDLKAKEVLRYWKEKNAKNATRKKLLQALKDCDFNLAKSNLETKWDVVFD